MTGTILGRVAWKEYRLLRSLWFAVLILALLCEAIVLWGPFSGATAHGLLLVPAVLVACYALGCGATAFAGEREAGTYGFQRALPVTPAGLFLGKLLFSVTSTILLGSLLWLGAVWLGRMRWPGLLPDDRLAAHGALKAVELLAWGMFFSLLSDKPLRTAIVAMFVASAVSYVLESLSGEAPAYMMSLWALMTTFVVSGPFLPRAGVAVLILACDAYLVFRWFREPAGAAGSPPREDAPELVGSRAHSSHRPWRQRLVWQSLRGARWMFALIVATYLIVLLVMASIDSPIRIGPVMIVAPLVVVGGLMGALVFHDDQRQWQFRFFAEHGVSARRVWCARHMFWAMPLMVGAFVLFAADIVHSWITENQGLPNWYFPKVLSILGFVVITYAAGQLCSLWLRSAVLLGITTLSLSVLLAFWALLAGVFSFHWSWTLAPIPLVLLFATWNTVDDWLLERRDFRTRMRKTAMVGIPTAAVLATAIVIRWTEIPVVRPSFETRQQLTEPQIAAAKKTGMMYAQAYLLYRSHEMPPDRRVPDSANAVIDPAQVFAAPVTGDEVRWLDENQNIVELTLDASRRTRFMVPDTRNQEWTTAARPLGLRHVLDLAARRYQMEGELDRALDMYLAQLRIVHQVQRHLWLPGDFRMSRALREIGYWAGAPGQKTAEIRRALKELAEIERHTPSDERWVENNYNMPEHNMPERASANTVDRFLRWYYRLLPWERVRLQRLLDISTSCVLTEIRWCRGRIRENKPVASRSLNRRLRQRIRRWSRATILPIHLPSSDYELPATIGTVTYHVSVWRGTQLVLALQAWRIEHGHFPESLDALVPEFLEKIPLDPITGQPFDYFPQGFSAEVTWRDPDVSRQTKLRWARHRPIVTALAPAHLTHYAERLYFPLAGAE